eukprot:PhF_6_TR13914/c1_g2_i1/m.22372
MSLVCHQWYQAAATNEERVLCLVDTLYYIPKSYADLLPTWMQERRCIYHFPDVLSRLEWTPDLSIHTVFIRDDPSDWSDEQMEIIMKSKNFAAVGGTECLRVVHDGSITDQAMHNLSVVFPTVKSIHLSKC